MTMDSVDTDSCVDDITSHRMTLLGTVRSYIFKLLIITKVLS